MSLYHKIADHLQFINPEFYKKRFFKKLKNLTRENVMERNVEPELLWIREQLTSDAVVLEIGANVGAYLYFLEKKIAPENIFAFEPNQKLYERLRRLFPKIAVHPIALSNENTTAYFKIPVIDGKEIASRGTLQTHIKEQNEQRTITQTVQVATLDDWIKKQPIDRIDFIKIDVEGNERLTLEGAQNTINTYQPMLMVEIEQRHHKIPVWEIILQVKNWGYSAAYLDREHFDLREITEELIATQNSDWVNDKKNYINNIIFLPKL